MTLELTLRNSDVSAKQVFMYRFDIEASDTTTYENIKRALNRTLMKLHGGEITKEVTEVAFIDTKLNEDEYLGKLDISYENTPQGIRAFVIVANGVAGVEGLELTIAMGKPQRLPVGVDDPTLLSQVPLGTREDVEIIDAHGLIDYWDREIRKGADGKIGEILRQKIRELTGQEVSIKYQN